MNGLGEIKQNQKNVKNAKIVNHTTSQIYLVSIKEILTILDGYVEDAI